MNDRSYPQAYPLAAPQVMRPGQSARDHRDTIIRSEVSDALSQWLQGAFCRTNSALRKNSHRTPLSNDATHRPGDLPQLSRFDWNDAADKGQNPALPQPVVDR